MTGAGETKERRAMEADMAPDSGTAPEAITAAKVEKAVVEGTVLMRVVEWDGRGRYRSKCLNPLQPYFQYSPPPEQQ